MFESRGLQSSVDPDLSDYPDFADLRAYWEGKRCDRSIPDRADIDPVALKKHLGSLFLAEPLPDLSNFRYRLVGTKLTSVPGREYTGRLVTDVFGGREPALAEVVLALYRKVLRENVVLLGEGTLIWDRQEFFKFAALHMPLSANGGDGRMIFGKMVFERLQTPLLATDGLGNASAS